MRFPELGRGWMGVLMVAAGLGAASMAPNDPAAPTLTRFSFLPPQGAAGIRVVLEGDGLQNARSVRFGSQPAPFRALGAGRVETRVPEGAATAPITLVTETGQTLTSGVPFQILPDRPQPPAITEFWPGSAPAGGEVSLSGTSLDAAEEVRVAGRSAEFTRLTDTDLVVHVPPDLTVSGPIAVISPFGTAVSGQALRVTAPAGL